MHYITDIKPLDNRVLRIELCTGSVFLLNMQTRLNTIRFAPLREEEIFQSVFTDGFYIQFDRTPNYELNFTLREAILMAMNPPPRTYEGLNPF